MPLLPLIPTNLACSFASFAVALAFFSLASASSLSALPVLPVAFFSFSDWMFKLVKVLTKLLPVGFVPSLLTLSISPLVASMRCWICTAVNATSAPILIGVKNAFFASCNVANGLLKSTPSVILPSSENAVCNPRTPSIIMPMMDTAAIPVLAINLKPSAMPCPAFADCSLSLASLTNSTAKSRKTGINAWAIWFFAPCTDKSKSSVEVFNSWVARMVFSSIVAPAFSAAVAQRSKPLPPSLRYGISNDASSATDSM